MYISLSSILSEKSNSNIIEIYFIKPIKNNDVVDIRIEDNIIKKISEKYKNLKSNKPVKYITYHRNELMYTYDLTDDNQIVYSKLMENCLYIDTNSDNTNLYMMSYKHSKVPIHLFPCLNDIDYVCEYTLTEIKLTNRLSLIIREDEYGKYVYIEYKHSSQVDIEKIEQNINNIIKNILS